MLIDFAFTLRLAKRVAVVAGNLPKIVSLQVAVVAAWAFRRTRCSPPAPRRSVWALEGKTTPAPIAPAEGKHLYASLLRLYPSKTVAKIRFPFLMHSQPEALRFLDKARGREEERKREV